MILWSKTIKCRKGHERELRAIANSEFLSSFRQGADRHARGGLREAGAPCLRHINLPILPPRACGRRIPDAHDRFSRHALAHAHAHALGHLDLGIAPAFGKWVLTLYRAGSLAFGVCYAPMAVAESANAQSVARARCRLSSMPQAGCRYCIVLRAASCCVDDAARRTR